MKSRGPTERDGAQIWRTAADLEDEDLVALAAQKDQQILEAAAAAAARTARIRKALYFLIPVGAVIDVILHYVVR